MVVFVIRIVCVDLFPIQRHLSYLRGNEAYARLNHDRSMNFDLRLLTRAMPHHYSIPFSEVDVRVMNIVSVIRASLV